MHEAEEYRVYVLDGAGHILRSHVVIGRDDGEAQSAARGLDVRLAKEIWRLARFVARIEAVRPHEDDIG